MPNRPTPARPRQTVARRTSPAPARRLPPISVQTGVFGALVVLAAGLLLAAASGPGTVELDGMRAREAIGDQAVRGTGGLLPRDATPGPTVQRTLDGGSVDPEDLVGYRWPVRREGRITSFFDWREEGFLAIDGRRFHEGIDMTTACGDEVYAAHGGIVLSAGRRFGPHMGFSGTLDRFYGRLERKDLMGALPIVVVVDDLNGYRSAYVHLESASVEKGDRVRVGDVVGRMGDTGNSTGCHLHYELFRMDGGWMSVAKELVRDADYPPFVRERIDPLRVLSLDDRNAPKLIPGVDPPKNPPRLKRSAQP